MVGLRFSLGQLLMVTFWLLGSNPSAADCVILLHGLARSAASMDELAKHLDGEGYHTVNLGYPSTEFNIETLANQAITPAVEDCRGHQTLNIVTHSLGGILVRQYLSQNSLPQLSRVVMLGPPNQGSEVVDKLQNLPGFYAINGDAGNQLGTDDTSIPNLLGPADFDLGIIAGTRSINLILSMLIPGPDDGKVSVERSKLEGMNDHLVLPVTHTFMMRNDQVMVQVAYYLKHGSFKRDT